MVYYTRNHTGCHRNHPPTNPPRGHTMNADELATIIAPHAPVTDMIIGAADCIADESLAVITWDIQTDHEDADMTMWGPAMSTHTHRETGLEEPTDLAELLDVLHHVDDMAEWADRMEVTVETTPFKARVIANFLAKAGRPAVA